MGGPQKRRLWKAALDRRKLFSISHPQGLEHTAPQGGGDHGDLGHHQNENKDRRDAPDAHSQATNGSSIGGLSTFWSVAWKKGINSLDAQTPIAAPPTTL